MGNRHIYITALHLNHGGAEMAICNLANGFAERGYEVTIWCIYHLCEPVYTIHPSVKIEYLTKDQPNRREFLAAVREFRILRALREGMRAAAILHRKKKVITDKIKSVNNGIILSTRLEHNSILAKYGGKNVIKIGQSHYGCNFNKKLIRRIQKDYIHLDYYVLLTESFCASTEKLMPEGHHCKCVAIGNYLEEADRKKLQEQDCKREKTVISVGRLSPEKGFDRLISAWNRIDQSHAEWNLLIIGDGVEREKLENMAKGHHVTFTGAMTHDKVIEFMKQSSVYAMASYMEGFPYVLLEACHAGLPIIAYDVPSGPSELICQGESGFLIPDGDEQMYGEKLELLLSDPALRKEMGEKGREHAERFSKLKTLDKWEELFS